MKYPLVSIILPVYNGASHIGETIASIQKSTYKNFEIILVDDASTDESKKMCYSLARKYKTIRFFAFVKNIGLSNVLNFAIRLAKGTYIARINQDDLMMPERLDKQVKFLENHTDHVAIGSSIRLFQNKKPVILASEKRARPGSDSGPSNSAGKRARMTTTVVFPETDEEIKRHWLYLSPFADPAVMYKKSAFDKTNGYNQDFWPVDDVHMWYQLGKLGKLANVNEALTFVRWHSQAGSIKRHKLQVQRLYALHQWAEKNIEKPSIGIKLFWKTQLISGILFPAWINWWMFRQLRRIIRFLTTTKSSYNITFLTIKNRAKKKTATRETTQPIKLSRSGV